MGFVLFTCALSLLIAASLMKGVESGFFGRFSAWVKGMGAVPRVALFVMCAAGMAYSQKPGTFTLFLNALFSSPQTLEEGLPVVGLHEAMLDVDNDGLADGVEMTGLLPVYDETANAGALIAGAARDWSLMWPYGVSAAVKEVALGMDFPFGGQSYSNIWLSATGLFSFDAPLNRAVPMLYPQAVNGKERLVAKIPQLAFLQGKTALHPSLGSDIWFDDSIAGVRQFAFDKIFLGSTTNVWVDALVEFHDNGAVRLAWVRSDEAAVNSAHTIGWQSSKTKGWDTLVGGVTLGEVASGSVVWLMPFVPTDPNNPDSDGDGGSDGDELIRFGTDPMVVDVDSDGDGFVDALEILLGTDPFDPLSYPNAALLALDSDGDGWADYLERILGSDPDEAVLKPNTFGSGICTLTLAPAETGAGASTLVCGGRLYPVLPETESVTIYTSFGEILPINWVGTPRTVIGAMGGNATMAFSHVEASAQPMMMTFSATPPRISEIALARVALFTSGEEAEKACIHPRIGARYVNAGMTQLPLSIVGGVSFASTTWNWSEQNAHDARIFNWNDENASLLMALTDGEALGNLAFAAVVSPTGLHARWRAQANVHIGVPVGRCPDAEEEEEPGDGTSGENNAENASGWCGIHDRLLINCPTDSECNSTTNAWCEIHLRDQAICDEDSTLTPESCATNAWCSVHERPIPLCREEKPEEECEEVATLPVRQYYRVFELNTLPHYNTSYSMNIPGHASRGNCCGCIDHGRFGTEIAAQNITSTLGLSCNPSPTATYQSLPGYVFPRTLSTHPFDAFFAFDTPTTTITNHCTIGLLKLEPALSRGLYPTDADILNWDALRQAKRPLLTLPHQTNATLPLNLRTQIALTNGYFTLSLDGPPGSYQITRTTKNIYGEDLPAIHLESGQRIDIPAADWFSDYSIATFESFRITVVNGGLARLTYAFNLQTEHGLITYRDQMFIKTLPPALLPDYNRDGLWDQIDLTAAKNNDRFTFWQNTDKDARDDDIPQTGSSIDSADSKVNGAKDLADFFPLQLNIREHLNQYPPERYTYHLYAPQSAVNILTYTLTPEGAQWVGNPDDALAYLIDAIAITNLLKTASGTQRINNTLELPTELLESIASTTLSHALLFEGRHTDSIYPALELRIKTKESNPKTRFTDTPNIYLVSVEKMFHYHNLLSFAEKDDSTIQDLYKSDHAPWGQDSQKQLFFCHGYNVNSSAARGWASEMFKRFYLSGNRAEFHAIHWHGFQSQIPILEVTPDFHSNVFNAFKTAPALATLINQQTNAGKTVVLAGHSLGSLLVSAAVCLEGARVSDLVLLNGAVAQEAYDPTADQPINMIHENWRKPNNVYTNRVFSSEWHTLFPETDPRSKLTIRGMFVNRNGANLHQYYSSGDEATGNIKTTLSKNPITDSKYAAWCVQELFKGRAWYLEPSEDGAIGGSKWMGWGFESSTSASTAAQLSDATLQQNPVFKHYPDKFFNLDDTGRQEYARTNRFEFIARAIPARTFSIGANEAGLNANFVTRQNLNDYVNEEENPWLGDSSEVEIVNADGTLSKIIRWLHSDIKNVPYVNTRSFFNDVIIKTNLKGE